MRTTTDSEVAKGHLHGHRGRGLAIMVVACSLVTACTSGGAPTPLPPSRGPSLAECQAYGVREAQITLKLPGTMRQEIRAPHNRSGAGDTGPELVVRGVDEALGVVNASAVLYDGPLPNTRVPDWVRSGIYVANIDEASLWGVKDVSVAAIALSALADSGQASDISHTTFTDVSHVTSATDPGTNPVTFDYWAFTASDHRYLLSYARTPDAKTPDAATFFATATSCPKSH